MSGEALKGSDGWGGKGMLKEIMAAQRSRNNHGSGDRLGGSGPSQGTEQSIWGEAGRREVEERRKDGSGPESHTGWTQNSDSQLSCRRRAAQPLGYTIICND